MNCPNKDHYFFTNGQRLCYGIDKWAPYEPNGLSTFYLLLNSVNDRLYDTVTNTGGMPICEYRCAKSSSNRRKRNTPLSKAATINPIDWRNDHCE